MARKFNVHVKHGFDYYEPKSELDITAQEKAFIAAISGQSDADFHNPDLQMDFSKIPLTLDFKNLK